MITRKNRPDTAPVQLFFDHTTKQLVFSFVYEDGLLPKNQFTV